VSNIGFGQDRPYGAFDDDDDFIEEWSASWEPASHSSVDDVTEPASETPPQHEVPEQANASQETAAAPAEMFPQYGSHAEPAAEAPAPPEPAHEMFPQYGSQGSYAEPVAEAPAAQEPEPAPAEMFQPYGSYNAPAETSDPSQAAPVAESLGMSQDAPADTAQPEPGTAEPEATPSADVEAPAAEAAPDVEHVYEEGLYAPAATEPETTEPAVLRGAMATLTRTRPWIMCEILPGRTEVELTDRAGIERVIRDQLDAGSPTTLPPQLTARIEEPADLTPEQWVQRQLELSARHHERMAQLLREQGPSALMRRWFTALRKTTSRRSRSGRSCCCNTANSIHFRCL